MTDSPRQPPWFQEADAVSLPDRPGGWAPQEHWAWARILRGLTADMSLCPSEPRPTGEAFRAWLDGKYDGAGRDANETEGEGDSARLKPWPPHRSISADFMRLVLFRQALIFARSHTVVRIVAAHFGDQLDWQNETLEGGLYLNSCRFGRAINWLDLRISGALNLSGSRLEGINGDGNSLIADRLTANGALLCDRNFTAKGAVRLLGARVKGSVSFIDASLENSPVSLHADGLVAETGLFCGGTFTAKGAVRILGAHLSGNVNFDGAQLQGADQDGDSLVADRVTIEGSLFCDDGFKARGSVRLLGGRIKGDASFLSADLQGVGASFICDGIEIEGALFLRGMKRLGSATFIRARVRGDVQVIDGTLDGTIDFTGALIEGELQTAQRAESRPGWSTTAKLVLRNATVGALAGGVGTFPVRESARDSAPMDLTGLTYARLGGLRASEGGSLADASVRQLKKWLTAGHDRRAFTPGPYRQLAQALVEAGHADKANDILHAMRAHERDCERDLLRRFALQLSGSFIGFGYRSQYAVFWFLALVLAFTAFGLNAPHILEPAQWRPFDFSGAGIAEFFRWLGFSFGNAIPLVSLDKAHETF